MTIAIVNFRTMKNGAYRYMAGKRRGYWRVLVVRDINGPLISNSRNVVSVALTTVEGIDGVTARSAYNIAHARAQCEAYAAHINAQRIAECLVAHHLPEGITQ